MVRQVASADDFGLGDWWSSIPRVTQFLASMWLGTAVTATFKILPLPFLYLDFYYIFRKGQIWRLVTHMSFLGGFSPHFAMRMIWLFIYSPTLERTMAEYEPGEYAFLILFSLCAFCIIGMINPFVSILFTASPMVFMIIYLWSREFASQEVSIYGLISIKGFYLPWAMLGIAMLFGASNNELMIDVTGIVVGHLYYFLKTIFPAQTGRHILKCPIWLSRFMSRYYKKAAVQSSDTHHQQRSEGGFQAFRGHSHRLQD